MARSENETANLSSGEEEEASSDWSGSESEPDKTSTPPPSSKKTLVAPNSSSDESGSESESDGEKTPEKSLVADPKIKPLASKPMDEEDQSKKSRSKNPTSRYSPPPLKSSTGKRSAAEAEGRDLKRIKKKTVVAVAAPDAENGGEKKKLFERLWSEEDEIELIQGMISYVEEKGKDPVADVNDFHEFVKKSLHVDVNTRQVTTKVRRLKKKFENNVAKVENKGKVRSFSNPHEKKMYELSKSLWGRDSNNNAVMSSRAKKVNVTLKTNKSRKSSKAVGSGNGNGGLEATAMEVDQRVGQALTSGHGLDQLGSMYLPITDELIMSRGLELLSGPKKVELEEKWKNLKVEELKHFLKKVELLKEQAELVLNVIEKSGAN